MYIIKKEKFGEAVSFILMNENTSEYAQIVPECGAILNALYFKNQNLYNTIDGFADKSDFDSSNDTSFKSNILFPYPNRVKGGKYKFENIDYQFNINFPQENNSIHGFVFNKIFEVIETFSSSDKALIRLKFLSSGDEGFPFPFSIMVSYTFSESGLDIETEIENTGTSNFPFGFGWHHYFRLNDDIDKLKLSFPSKSILEVDTNMIPTGNKNDYNLFNNAQFIDSTNLDNCFYLGKSGNVSISLRSLNNDTFQMKFDSNVFPYLQVYTPPARTTIAIEPMTCAPDVFNNEFGLIILEPNTKHKNKITLSK